MSNEVINFIVPYSSFGFECGSWPMEMRDTCELCGIPLAMDAIAFVCSYECTFCGPCAGHGEKPCPNCGGELVRRPRRLLKNPSSSLPGTIGGVQ
jgi:hypothetical protein